MQTPKSENTQTGQFRGNRPHSRHRREQWGVYPNRKRWVKVCSDLCRNTETPAEMTGGPERVLTEVNQDQAQTYDFRANYGQDVGSSNGNGTYITKPTNDPSVVQTLFYMSRTVPSLYNPDGSQNQPTPNTYGMLRYWLESTDPQLPAPGQVVHRMQRLGQTLRGVILVLRATTNSLRATAESNMPTSIQVKIGDQTLFTETYAARRYLMRRRYGFDAPDGVLVYDWTHDFGAGGGYGAGGEFGDDWIYTQDITQFQFVNTYPSGFAASAGNLLTYLTDDMSIPAGVDPMNV